MKNIILSGLLALAACAPSVPTLDGSSRDAYYASLRTIVLTTMGEDTDRTENEYRAWVQLNMGPLLARFGTGLLTLKETLNKGWIDYSDLDGLTLEEALTLILDVQDALRDPRGSDLVALTPEQLAAVEAHEAEAAELGALLPQLDELRTQHSDPEVLAMIDEQEGEIRGRLAELEALVSAVAIDALRR